jgi:beta-lactamase class A
MVGRRSWIDRRGRAVVALFALLLGATVAPTQTGASTRGPAARQLGWLLSQVNAARTPTQADIAVHFSSGFLKDVPPSALVLAIGSISAQRPMHIASIVGPVTPLKMAARLTTARGPDLLVTIAVSAQPPNRIDSVDFVPSVKSTPVVSWASADRALARLGSHVGLFAAQVSGGRLGRIIYARNADAPEAVGSAFKLYVLGALAHAVRDKRAAWSEQLAVHESWKSLPPVGMQTAAAGSHFTLRYYAEQMISVSDNTATDHLIHRLGRAAIEHEFVVLGNRSAGRDRPLLTTREAFDLKLAAPPSLLARFAAAGERERRDLLRQADALALNPASLSGWIAPRQIGTVEWFASPSDLGRAMIALEALANKPGLDPVR